MKPLLSYVLVALISMIVVWAIYPLVVLCFVHGDLGKSGQWGDTFGALNTLFTGFAFIVVLAALWLQSKQIADTKTDLHEERELQRRTAELVAEQAKALASQVRVEALTSRIEAYHVQIADAKERRDESSADRMIKERHSLLLRLDTVLREHGD